MQSGQCKFNPLCLANHRRSVSVPPPSSGFMSRSNLPGLLSLFPRSWMLGVRFQINKKDDFGEGGNEKELRDWRSKKPRKERGLLPPSPGTFTLPFTLLGLKASMLQMGLCGIFFFVADALPPSPELPPSP